MVAPRRNHVVDDERRQVFDVADDTAHRHFGSADPRLVQQDDWQVQKGLVPLGDLHGAEVWRHNDRVVRRADGLGEQFGGAQMFERNVAEPFDRRRVEVDRDNPREASRLDEVGYDTAPTASRPAARRS